MIISKLIIYNIFCNNPSRKGRRRGNMEYVIGIILAIIALIIIGLILRKRLYDAVDYYESWKLDIMNRNIANELAKVKQLTLQGETKEKFKQWKTEWDNILTKDLANVEELLYDTEYAADRYFFRTAKQNIAKMETILTEAEQKIENMLNELEDLLKTEEKNRSDMEKVGPRLEELRKQLAANRYIYKRAEVRLEVAFDELDEALHTYSTYMDEGNYHQATEMMQEVKERLDQLEAEMDSFPVIYKRCKDELPAKLDELTKGIKEMRSEGFHLDHLNLTQDISKYQSRLLEALTSLEKTGVHEAEKVADEIDERIDEMYDILETEALAKNYVNSKLPNFEQSVKKLSEQFVKTQEEVDTLKETYFFEDVNLENFMSLEKEVMQIEKLLKEMLVKVETETYAHSKLRQELEEAFDKLDTLRLDHDTFVEKIQNMRKDEIEVRNELEKMNDKLFRVTRRLRNSNIPEVPTHIWNLIDEAGKKNDFVLEALEESPLDIGKIQTLLQEAKEAVETSVEHTNTMLEQAMLTERVIQYANRYRSSNPILASKLKEAESLFRKAQYEAALETAARAVEEVEPGALKKIEKIQEMNVS